MIPNSDIIQVDILKYILSTLKEYNFEYLSKYFNNIKMYDKDIQLENVDVLDYLYRLNSIYQDNNLQILLNYINSVEPIISNSYMSFPKLFNFNIKYILDVNNFTKFDLYLTCYSRDIIEYNDIIKQYNIPNIIDISSIKDYIIKYNDLNINNLKISDKRYLIYYLKQIDKISKLVVKIEELYNDYYDLKI